jgi:hypothetical protein
MSQCHFYSTLAIYINALERSCILLVITLLHSPSSVEFEVWQRIVDEKGAVLLYFIYNLER